MEMGKCLHSKPEHLHPRTQVKNWPWFIIWPLGRWRQGDPWGLLTRQPERIGELQLSETFTKHRMDNIWKMTPQFFTCLLIHSNTHILHAHTNTCICTYTHSHKETSPNVHLKKKKLRVWDVNYDLVNAKPSFLIKSWCSSLSMSPFRKMSPLWHSFTGGIVLNFSSICIMCKIQNMQVG